MYMYVKKMKKRKNKTRSSWAKTKKKRFYGMLKFINILLVG